MMTAIIYKIIQNRKEKKEAANMPVFFFNFSYVSYVWFLKILKENVRERK